jgi:hypothetical protein
MEVPTKCLSHGWIATNSRSEGYEGADLEQFIVSHMTWLYPLFIFDLLTFYEKFHALCKQSDERANGGRLREWEDDYVGDGSGGRLRERASGGCQRGRGGTVRIATNHNGDGATEELLYEMQTASIGRKKEIVWAEPCQPHPCTCELSVSCKPSCDFQELCEPNGIDLCGRKPTQQGVRWMGMGHAANIRRRTARR